MTGDVHASARKLAPKAWAALGKQNDSGKHRDGRIASLVAAAALVESGEAWEIIQCDRALYVDHGKAIILCDRLPSPVTLLVKRRAMTRTEESDR